MLKTREGRTSILNYVCSGFTFILLVLQFLPFWQYGKKAASINGYVWWNPQNEELTDWFTSKLGSELDIYVVVIPAVLILLFCCFGIAFCILKSRKWLPALLPAAAGLTTIIACTIIPAFKLGSTCAIQLVLGIVIFVLAIATIVNGLIKEKE